MLPARPFPTKGREPLPLPWAHTEKMRYRIVDAGVARQTADKMVTEGDWKSEGWSPGAGLGERAGDGRVGESHPGALNSAVECHLHTVEVIGSNPVAPTILKFAE